MNMWQLVGSCAGIAFFAARVGLFGTTKIVIYSDSDYESINNYLLWHKARWIPADIRSMVHQVSLRPIEFVFVDEKHY